MGAQLTNSDIDQMKTTMTYFLKHNNEHIKDINKWLKKAEDLGLNKVVHDLREINQLSEEISRHFEAVVKTLESYKWVNLKDYG